MDTTHLAFTAEDYISYQLQSSGLLVTKPKFDRNGTDLIVLMQAEDGAKFCRVQCKGRRLFNTKHSNVSIPKEYVTDGFILFIYIESSAENSLFCFTKDDIVNCHAFKVSNFSYKINIYSGTYLNKKSINNINAYKFDIDKSIDKIKLSIIKSISDDEFKLIEIVNHYRKINESNNALMLLEKSLYELHHAQEKIELIKQYEDCLTENINLLARIKSLSKIDDKYD